MREYIQYLSYWDWLNSLNVIISSCIHFPVNGMSSFLFMAGKFSIEYKSHVFFLHSLLLDTYVGSTLRCYECATGNMDVQVPRLLFVGFHSFPLTQSHTFFSPCYFLELYDFGLVLGLHEHQLSHLHCNFAVSQCMPTVVMLLSQMNL